VRLIYVVVLELLTTATKCYRLMTCNHLRRASWAAIIRSLQVSGTWPNSSSCSY